MNWDYNKLQLRKGNALFLVFFIIASFCPAQTVDSNYVDGEIYLKVRDTSNVQLAPYDHSIPALNALFPVYSIDTIVQPFPGLNATLDNTYRIHFSNYTGVDGLITDLSSLSFTEYAEKSPLYKTQYEPNDIATDQWAYEKIHAKAAWDVTKGNSDVVIAIVDNAVSTTHEDLKGNLWVNSGETPGNGIDDDLNGYTDDVNGWDVADNDNNPNPPDTAGTSSPFIHGTHCAGIASAQTDNGKGIASIGFQTTYMPVKCSKDGSGGKALSNAYDGVYYAMRQGADVINMSWGGTQGMFLTGESIMNTAHSMGVVLIAAAGNDDTTQKFYPAAYENVIAVGATDQNDKKAGFSNYGSYIDVMAPGTGLYSTYSGANDAYGFSSGTSMASPVVAGLAGLVLSVDGNLSPNEVKGMIESGCVDIDENNGAYTGKVGAGRVDAAGTLNATTGTRTADKEHLSLNVFPNPTDRIVSVAGLPPGFYRFTITDLNGRVVLENNREFKFPLRLELNDLPRGIYLMEFDNNKKPVTAKIQVR